MLSIDTLGYELAAIIYLLGAAMYVITMVDAETHQSTSASTLAGILWPYAACVIIFLVVSGRLGDDDDEGDLE